jgi:uncharacterized membrane protein YoaK (UPF0700 family)
MATADFVERHWPKMGVALVLTFASGLVDIVGYLGIFHFFTAHLTGTTVQLGLGLATHQRVDVFAAGSVAAAFVAGSLFGRALIELAARKQILRVASITLVVEAAVLAAATAVSGNYGSAPYAGLALLAGAMGIQTATLTGIGPLTVHTTFVTGMVNKIAQLVSHILFRSYDFRHGRALTDAARGNQRRDIEMALFLTTIWCSYVAGAAFGTWSFDLWELKALFVAIGLLALGLVADALRPLSIQEEKEQSER